MIESLSKGSEIQRISIIILSTILNIYVAHVVSRSPSIINIHDHFSKEVALSILQIKKKRQRELTYNFKSKNQI